MTNLGKYEIREVIGEGGFGRVFRGFDPILKREVAIKLCTIQQEDFRRRFLREGEIAAGLRHPNIVTIYDIGEADGEPYLVQEYLGGEDLDGVIERADPLPMPTKVEYLAQIADGLAHAHERGVIHRDIKPSNIRVPGDSQIRILDFGIAKLVNDELRLTQTGSSVGTIGYLAPEQLGGGRIDHRADIFSFGVLAYELLTYRRPFNGESISAVLYQIAYEDPPIEPMRPECSARLITVVMRCMRKVPEDRFVSCAEIAAELRGVAQEYGTGVGIPMSTSAREPSTVLALVEPIARTHGQRTRYPLAPTRRAPLVRAAAAGSGALAMCALVWAGFAAMKSTVDRPTVPPAVGETAHRAIAKTMNVDAQPVTVQQTKANDTASRGTSTVPAEAKQVEHSRIGAAVTHDGPTRSPASASHGAPAQPVASRGPAISTAPLDDRLVVLAVRREPKDTIALGAALDRAVESGLRDVLAATGLRVAPVDESATASSRDAHPDGVIARGRAIGAGRAIIAFVSVVQQEDALRMKSALCTLELRVFDVRTADLLAEASERVAGPGGSIDLATDRAVHNCVKKTGDKLVQQLK